jgi:hypothetical protein
MGLDDGGVTVHQANPILTSSDPHLEAITMLPIEVVIIPMLGAIQERRPLIPKRRRGQSEEQRGGQGNRDDSHAASARTATDLARSP